MGSFENNSLDKLFTSASVVTAATSFGEIGFVVLVVVCWLCYHHGIRKSCSCIACCVKNIGRCLSWTFKNICVPCMEGIFGEILRYMDRQEENRRQRELETGRQLRVTEYNVQTMLARYNSDMQTLAPDYWQFYRKSMHHSLVNVVSSARSTSHRTELGIFNGLFSDVKQLIEGSWKRPVVGQGQDARGLQPSDIFVRRVWLIENPQLYISYLKKRGQFHLKATRRQFPAIEGLCGQREIFTRFLAIQKLNQQLDMNINEYYLLHGTKSTALDGIVDQGLDNRLSPGGLFGNGIYLAERSTKSDQYADDKLRRVGANVPLYMFVVRTLLGNCYVCNKGRYFSRHPCSVRGRYTENSITMFDSVMGVSQDSGQTKLLFREFIVYDKDQCYPEFLVEYVRVQPNQTAA